MSEPLRLFGGGMCPEQYEVYHGSEEVGYLRLRHGSFRAECRHEIVYATRVGGEYCGAFLNDEERNRYLQIACAAICDKLGIAYIGFIVNEG